MIFIYDNLTATLVSGAVLLILFSMQVRLGRLNVEQTSTYMSKMHSLDFADWLEDDLLDMGKHMDEAKTPLFDELEYDSAGRTTRFTFFRNDVVDDDGDGFKNDTLQYAIRYDLAYTETREVDGEEVDLFQVERRVCTRKLPAIAPCLSYELTGSSIGLLQHFKIDMLDRDGASISDASTVAASDPFRIQQTRVQFAMASPVAANTNQLRTMHWGATLLLRR